MKNNKIIEQNYIASINVLYMALELSADKWRIAFGNGSKQRQIVIKAGNLLVLSEEIRKAKQKLHLTSDAPVISCYEAGRDGFWIHRYLMASEVKNYIVDSSSIEVNRRARRAKTDRLDAQKLLLQLIRYEGGEKGVWRIIHVPSEKEEDARRLHRERQSLKKEWVRHINRIKSLLALQGIYHQGKGWQTWQNY